MTNEQYLKNLAPPNGRFSVILDTDTYNEIDDQYAIAYLLSHNDRADIRGFTAAPFLNQRSISPADGMEKSYNEIQKLLSLAGRSELAKLVYRGSERYLPSEDTPVISDAAEHIAAEAAKHTADDPLYIVSIGAITNVASALLLHPNIKESCVIVWLGGNARHYPRAFEFNMRQDVAAARVVIGSGAPFAQLPCYGVVDRFLTTQPELEHWLGGKNPLCDHLLKETVIEAERLQPGQPWCRILWDVTGIAWLFNRGDRFFTSKIVPALLPEYNDRYSTEPLRHMICYVDYVFRDAIFEDMFNRLSHCGQKKN